MSERAELTREQSRFFLELAGIFNEAVGTDEAHACSGESDRLLSIASDMARLFAEGKTLEDRPHCIAFDLAALVRAARLVPGDTESAERRDLLDRAGPILMQLAGTDGDVIAPLAERPVLSRDARAITSDTPITEAGEVAKRLMAWCTYEIETLASEVTLLGDECSASGENRIGALLRCYGTRIEALNSMLMSFLDGEKSPVGDVHRELYRGAKLFDPKEYGAHAIG